MHGDARNAVVSLGGLIIDDVAIPGQTLRRDLLGGSGVHAAFGMGMATKALAANDVESFIVAKVLTIRKFRCYPANPFFLLLPSWYFLSSCTLFLETLFDLSPLLQQEHRL